MEALGEAPQGPLRLMNTLRALLTVWVCQVMEPRPVFMALEGALRDRAGPTQAILSPGAEAMQAPRANTEGHVGWHRNCLWVRGKVLGTQE